MAERILPTSTEDEQAAAVAAATMAVHRGQLVVLPTDTVYGVGADAFDPEAVERLLDAKGRGRQMPPPVLVAKPATMRALATGIPSYAEALAERFWPGPLTLICTEQTSLQWDLGETNGTVALRMPDHPIALALLERTGPLAVSSANTTGSPAAVTAEEARQMLGSNVSVYLDAGDAPGGVASTILDCTGEHPEVLRLGALNIEVLNEVLQPLGLPLADGR
ncbi:MAG: L-threonylcarbamoyladenylate synthase [Nocardioides sp.]